MWAVQLKIIDRVPSLYKEVHELGYQTQGDSNGGVVLPCTGESTLPLRGQEGFDSETKQEEEITEFQ